MHTYVASFLTILKRIDPEPPMVIQVRLIYETLRPKIKERVIKVAYHTVEEFLISEVEA